MAPIYSYLLRFKLMKVAGWHVFFVFKILIWIVIRISMNTIRNPCIYLFVQTYQNDSDSQSLSLIIWVGIGLSGASNILFFRGIIGLFSDFSRTFLVWETFSGLTSPSNLSPKLPRRGVEFFPFGGVFWLEDICHCMEFRWASKEAVSVRLILW